ncbi:MAG TPA: DUF5683 domain-containing protein [Saprospiraceae bacterium]|nr:DUF5683 domain-containing protein [Saprospiraceae bacterium]
MRLQTDKNRFLPALVLTLALFLISNIASAQEQADSAVTVVKKEKKGSIFAGRPGKSMLFSLIIPGAGQIYNKSYLRLPFVYGAVGGMGAVLIYNTRQYNCLKTAYIARVDGTTPDLPKCHQRETIMAITDPARLRILRDQANADRQLSIVGFALVWLANGVDAFVDAHLKDFDVNEDLSFEFRTQTFNDPFAPMRAGLYVQF